MDEKSEVWVLGLSGLIGSSLLAGGQFDIYDSIVGVLVILILMCVTKVSKHSPAFKRAYSALMSLGIVIVISPAVLYVFYVNNIIGETVLQETFGNFYGHCPPGAVCDKAGGVSNLLSQGTEATYVISLFQATLASIWLVISFVIYFAFALVARKP